MPSSLIRGKYVIASVSSPTHAEILEDAAVFQRDGIIVEVGPYQDLRERHGDIVEIVGSSDDVVLPGFTNSHHHVGLTPLQLGSPDLPLEVWFASRGGARSVDPYLDTLYSAFEMVESGVTTVQHLDGWRSSSVDQMRGRADQVLKAYQDIGMRVSYSFATSDQNRLVYEADQEFVRRVPPELQPALTDWFADVTLSGADQLGLFEDLYARYCGRSRIKIQLAPANLHWCSDDLLGALQECATRYSVPLHMHLLETAYQKEYARRRTGTTAVRHLHRLGLLGPRMTFGHGVWVTEEDIDLIAATGTRVCHNASSNLRLRSGVLPLNSMLSKGIQVGLGLDEAGINDDRDMLQELKLVLRLHRTPGMDDSVVTSYDVLRMATQYGAATTPYDNEIGAIAPGREADMVLLRWNQIAYPYLDEDTSVVDAIVQRGRSSGVHTVLVAGEPILREGNFTRVDKHHALEQLASSLSVDRTVEDRRRRELMRKLQPHVKRFYEGYLDGEVREPFYQPSSRR